MKNVSEQLLVCKSQVFFHYKWSIFCSLPFSFPFHNLPLTTSSREEQAITQNKTKTRLKPNKATFPGRSHVWDSFVSLFQAMHGPVAVTKVGLVRLVSGKPLVQTIARYCKYLRPSSWAHVSYPSSNFYTETEPLYQALFLLLEVLERCAVQRLETVSLCTHTHTSIAPAAGQKRLFPMLFSLTRPIENPVWNLIADKQWLHVMAKEITQREGIPVPGFQPVMPQCPVHLVEKTGAFSPKLYRILKKHPLITGRELFAFQIGHIWAERGFNI